MTQTMYSATIDARTYTVTITEVTEDEDPVVTVFDSIKALK